MQRGQKHVKATKNLALIRARKYFCLRHLCWVCSVAGLLKEESNYFNLSLTKPKLIVRPTKKRWVVINEAQYCPFSYFRRQLLGIEIEVYVIFVQFFFILVNSSLSKSRFRKVQLRHNLTKIRNPFFFFLKKKFKTEQLYCRVGPSFFLFFFTNTGAEVQRKQATLLHDEEMLPLCSVLSFVQVLAFFGTKNIWFSCYNLSEVLSYSQSDINRIFVFDI